MLHLLQFSTTAHPANEHHLFRQQPDITIKLNKTCRLAYFMLHQ